MSTFPPQSTLPPPKSLTKKSFSSKEHDRLLRKVWGSLETLAATLYLDKSKASVKKSAETSISDYKKKLADSFAVAQKRLATCEDINQKHQLTLLVQQLQAAQHADAPEVPPAMYLLEIESKSLAEPITIGTTWDKKRIVGYIDIELNLRVPTAIFLSSEITPFEITPFPDGLTENAGEHSAQVGLDAPFGSRQGPPEWHSNPQVRRIWIDVRPELGPLGQMLRELKVLRDHAGPGTDIVVVFGSDDPQALAMLAHEGFLAVPERLLKENSAP